MERLQEYAANIPARFRANFGDRYVMIGFRPMSVHPDDAYLWVVIGARYDSGEAKYTFAKWTHNASDGGFSGGHYDLSLVRALELLGCK